MFLDPAMERDLRLIAEREGRSTASVVREALTDWIAGRKAALPPRPGFVAAGRSGVSDTAERHESLLFTVPPATRRPKPSRGSRRAGTRKR